jgi:hypothetical protein
MSIDTRLKAGQTAACPNPSREAKPGGDRKRQQGLRVVFHAVLQYTRRSQDGDRLALQAAYVSATDENSNGCLSRSFANIKKLPPILVPMCCVGHTARCANTADVGCQSKFTHDSTAHLVHVLGSNRENT